MEVTDNDFNEAVGGASAGDFVYFDPPYDPLSDSSSFTGYNLNAFGKKEQENLKQLCDELIDRGCYILLSNSATDFIRGLFSDEERYTIKEVEAHRNINSVATGRGKINELLIFSNYNVA